MKLELAPTLEVQRQLYTLPRDQARFDWYIRTIRGDHKGRDNELAVPIVSVNPMGKEHCLRAVEALLALDAEAVVQQALDEASARLAGIEGEMRVCLNLLDDVAGGWTDRYLNELRFASQAGLRANRNRRWLATIACWASETYTRDILRQETLATVYRNTAWQRLGLARTLGEQMQREGQAIAFALDDPTAPTLLAPRLSAKEVEQAQSAIDRHREATDYPTQFACLFGDEAALEVGFPALGVSNRAGFALALDEARRGRTRPEQALGGAG